MDIAMKKHDKITLLESQLWLTLLKMGLITSQSSNPQIVDRDEQIIQFVFDYLNQKWAGSARYCEADYGFPLLGCEVSILSIDYQVKPVWDSTLCDYVWVQRDSTLT